MAQATDGFERASLGASWTGVEGSPTIYDNSDAGGSVPQGNAAYYNAGGYGADQFSRIRIAACPTGGHQITASVRVTAGIDTPIAYMAQTDCSTFFRIACINDGNFDIYVEDLVGPFPAVGDTIKINVVGSTTPVLKAYRNETQILTYTVNPGIGDAVLTTGQPGWSVYYAVDPPLGRIEQWWGGDGLGAGVLFDQAMSISSNVIATLARPASLKRTISLVTEAAIATVAKAATFRKSLFYSATSAAIFVSGNVRFVSAFVQALCLPTLTRMRVAFVDMSTSTLSAGTLLLSAAYQRALSLAALCVPTMTRIVPLLKALNVTAVTIPTLARVKVILKALSLVTSVGLLTLLRQTRYTLSATAVSFATTSRGIFKTMVAMVVSALNLTKVVSGPGAPVTTTIKARVAMPAPIARVRMPLSEL